MYPVINTTAFYISPGLGKMVSQTIEQTIQMPKIVIIETNSKVVIG